jgi:pimeloyl-ACP methyl ester carboxylesterase
MAFSANASPPACPPSQTVGLAHGTVSFRARGSGDTIVFLHGLLGSSRSWAFQFAHFGKAFRAVAWDAPGYAGSAPLAPSIDAYAEALRAFVATLGSDKVVLVGHSMGGAVATRLAARHPSLVSRLVLSCSHPGYGAPESAPMPPKFEQRMHELKELGPTAYGKARAHDLLPMEVAPALRAYAAEVAAETAPEGLRLATRMLQLADNRPLLPGLAMPVLILTGGVDTTVTPALKADLLRLAPQARHIEMPGLGHAPYFQAPDYYDGLIEDFISAR